VREAVKNPAASAQQIRQNVGPLGASICLATVKNVLKKAGLSAHRPMSIPCLNKSRCMDRLQWAHVHSVYDAADWKNVIFTDETTVQLNHHTVPFVRRRKDEKIRPVHCRETKTITRKVMFWGSISGHGAWCLVPIHGTLNAVRYVELLQQHLLPLAAHWYGNESWELHYIHM
jgi:hypothetical protein